MISIHSLPHPEDSPPGMPVMVFRKLIDGLCCDNPECSSRKEDEHFGLLEYYCSNPGCLCKRVVIKVVGLDDTLTVTDDSPTVATLSYSWRSLKKVGKATFAPEEKQTARSSEILAEFKRVINEDAELRELIYQHYQYVKEYYGSQKTSVESSVAKLDRNAPCPCGSGKKYKKCCLLAD